MLHCKRSDTHTDCRECVAPRSRRCCIVKVHRNLGAATRAQKESERLQPSNAT
jgi:hypothetical protein